MTKNMTKKIATEDIILIVAACIIVGLFVYLGIVRFTGDTTKVLTIDEMHELNLKGKLKEQQGYMYHGHSFINYSNIWYSQLVSSKGSIFDVAFNYDPLKVENIPVYGSLNEAFLSRDTFYITFNPTATGLGFVAKANAGFSTAMVKAFKKNLVAGCTKNETAGCANAPIITCDNDNQSVIVFSPVEPTQISLEGNCVIVQGKGEELVKAKDRLLMRWYGMMDTN